mgnify:CR=1 FL=1
MGAENPHIVVKTMSIKWEQKVLEGRGKFINRLTRTGKKLYDRFFIYVPTEVARDSLFPFKPGEPVKIRIDPENRRLIIEKFEGS